MRRFWLAGAPFLLAACGARSGLDEGSGAASGTGLGGAAQGSGSVGSSNPNSSSTGYPAGCDGLPGPAMVKVQTKAGNAYCIDSTEVTNADYKAFIDSKPSLANQPPECSFNQSYLPQPSPPMAWPVAGFEDYPVHFIDWCDARAYCAFAGKRLCGLVGGAANPTNTLDPDMNEWMNACTRQGTRPFAYDNNYHEGACNVGSPDIHTDKSAPVASFPQCQGGFDGLYDMLGNVSEFVNACANGACPSMGSSYFDDVGPCGVWLTLSIVEGGALGIRCCRDSD